MKKTVGWTLLLVICFVLSQKVAFSAEVLMDSIPSEELFDGSLEGADTTEKYTVEDNIEIRTVPSGSEVTSVEPVFASDIIYCPRKFYFHTKTFLAGTEIEIHQDWSFTIDNVVRGGPDEGPGYSTTWYIAHIEGQFAEPIKLNEYSYCFQILYAKSTYEEGYQYIQNNIRYYAVGADEIINKDQFILYLPGTPLSMFPGSGSFMVDNCLDTEAGVIRDGSYVLDCTYVGSISSEEDRLILPNSSSTPTPTPTISPTPTPNPTPAIPFSSEIPPEVTGFYNSIKGADLRWTEVPGAEGYNIYRKRSADGTKKVATINGQEAVQYYDGEIKDNCWGRVYVYYVIPFAGAEKGEASTQVTLQRLAPMKITAYENNSVGSVDLSWTCTVNENKALGYEIQYATSKEDLFGQTGSFRKVAVNGRNKLSKTITDLAAGETYFFRIRCYVNYIHSVTGKKTKTWSQYSDVVKVLIQQ